MGDFVDVLTEVHRLDIATWGDTRTALVFRCVAAASLKEGKPVRVNSVALALGLGLATVHDRMLKLLNWTDPETGESQPLIERVTDGYVLSAAGEQAVRTWLESFAQAARCATNWDFQTLLTSVMYYDGRVGSE